METTEIFEHGYAVVVGVDENKIEQLALPAVKKDVQALYDVLVHPNRCAYEPDNVKLLKGKESTRRNILEALYWLQNQAEADPQATSVVYYSGHGMRVKESDEYYLIPYDIRSRDRVRADALRAAEFAAEINEIEAERLLVMLDCCHAGGMGVKDLEAVEKGPSLVPGAFPIDAPDIEDIPEYRGDAGSKEIGDLLDGKGRAILNSSTGDESSYVRRDNQMSVFTYHVIEALTGHAPHPDDAKVVYVTDVMSWVTHEVKKTAADYSVKQTPEMRTTGVFPVAQLIGGKGLAKGLGEAPPDPLQPLPDVGHVEGSIVSGAVDTGGGDFAGRDMDKSTTVTFNQQKQTVGGSQTNIGEMRGDIGHIGDVVRGDSIRVGDISGSSGVAIGRGAIASVTVSSMPTADDAARKELEQLVAQLNELLKQTPLDQQQVGEQVAEATELLINTAASEKTNPTMIEALGDGLKETARKLGDNLPGIIELTTKIAAAVAAIAGAVG